MLPAGSRCATIASWRPPTPWEISLAVSAPKDSTASSNLPRTLVRTVSSEFPYAALGHATALHPAVDAVIQGYEGQQFPVRMLVDSGADCSCFPEGFALKYSGLTSIPARQTPSIPEMA